MIECAVCNSDREIHEEPGERHTTYCCHDCWSSWYIDEAGELHILDN